MPGASYDRQSGKERTAVTKKVNKVTLLLRVLVSVYVLYLAYGLIKDYAAASNQMLSLAAIIVFIAGGGLILVTSAYKLITKDYDDGSEEDEGQQEPEQTESAGGEEPIGQGQAAGEADGQRVDQDGLR